MLFASMVFLWVFLPVVIIGNMLLSLVSDEKLCRTLKNIWLLIASFVFYAWGGIYYLLIMLSSIAVNYTAGRLMEKRRRKGTLVCAIVLNLAILFFFKYFNMLVVVVENLFVWFTGKESAGASLRAMLMMQGTGQLGIKEIVLPIGISFFTFQAMSYVIDVYKGKARIQKNIAKFALYVALFPQLIAGPIVKYSDVEGQIENRKESIAMFASGQRRFICGLAKKVLLANTFALTADAVWKSEPEMMGSATAWLGALAYTMQIYYDFSGYSDMAIGLGRMFGFRFKENFAYPYTSLSIQEFWRRWHISLSSWFKEYVYFPLGGSRCGNVKTYRNVFIVFLLTGIWHGANFTFLMWGIMYALLQVIERLFLGKVLEKNPIKPVNLIYTMLMVILGWVLFRSDNIVYAIHYIGAMFGAYNHNVNAVLGGGGYQYLGFMSMELIIAFVFGILGMGFMQRGLKRLYDGVRTKEWFMVLDMLVMAGLLMLCILRVVSGTYNPFIYFQF
jgi:alginate O-acetyltransferase complex protein AlgI